MTHFVEARRTPAERRTLGALPRLGDLEARAGMLLAACLAGAAIDSGGTAVAHALGHALGTVGRIHHGRAVGLGLRALAREVLSAH